MLNHLQKEAFEKRIEHLGEIDEATYYAILAEIIEYPYVLLDSQPYVCLIEPQICINKHFCFFQDSSSNSQLSLAISDPTDIIKKDFIKDNISEKIEKIYIASPGNIENFIIKNKQKEQDSEEIIAILSKAVIDKVSDIHFQPKENSLDIFFRIDGILRLYKSCKIDIWPRLLSQFKIMTNMNIAEKRRPQSGGFSKVIYKKTYNFRLSMHPTVYGENAVLRVLEKNKIVSDIKELGFDNAQIKTLLTIIKKPHGLFVVCGSTGSGKSTTIYSLLSNICDGKQNIMTIEEPVEYHLPNIRQTELFADEVLSYKDAIKSLLRQDPDIIFLGEIRDEISAQMALRAALTGHLVIATLHASDAISAIYRLSELGICFESLASNLLGIAAQTLIRKICTQCLGKGCESCFYEGLQGRTVIAEILEMSDSVREYIAEAADNSILRENVQYKTMAEHAHEKVQAKITSAHEMEAIFGKSDSEWNVSHKPNLRWH